VTYPISLTKLYVVMNRQTLDPTEWQPVPPAIRISCAEGYGKPALVNVEKLEGSDGLSAGSCSSLSSLLQ